jgi:uncharacterized protein (TIGR02246 family)
VKTDLSAADRAAIEAIVRHMEAAWNQLDGATFATPFADDADFVNIRGEHFRGRPAIAAGHNGIFKSIYAGSTNQYAMEDARLLRADVALARVHAILDVPQGPLKGRHTARFTMTLTKDNGEWEIASFHNTLESPPAAQLAPAIRT